MKKTLVALAVLSSVTGAFAEVTISGNLNQAVTTDTLKGGTEEYGVQGMHSISGDSFLTFSGNEDMGNGLKASFKLEQALDLNGNVSTTGSMFGTNTTGNGNREAWVGVSSDIGTLSFGNQYAPSFLAAIGADPMGANNIKGAMGNLGISTVLGGNSIVYASPAFNGFTASVMQNYGANETTNSTYNAGNAVGYSLSYASGPLSAAYGNQQATLNGSSTYQVNLVDIGAGALIGAKGTATAKSGTDAAHYSSNYVQTAAAVSDGDTRTEQTYSISYDLGMAKVGYWGSKTNYTAGDQVQGQSAAISAPFGSLTLAYTFGTGSATPNGGTTTDYTGYQYSAKYALSKRTYAYVEGGSIKDTTHDETRQTYGFGLNHSF